MERRWTRDKGKNDNVTGSKEEAADVDAGEWKDGSTLSSKRRVQHCTSGN